MQIDYLNAGQRKQILDEILNNEENLRRKELSVMQYEVYMNRQRPFVLRKIADELGMKAVQNSRVISSINMAKKIVNEQAQIYRYEPLRMLENASEDVIEHFNNLYSICNVNAKMKKTNRIYKLQDQATLQVVPKEGKIDFRPLYQHHYDVVASSKNPEKAECYIISSFDKSRLMNRLIRGPGTDVQTQRGYYSDRSNQKIGDPDDYQKPNIFYWWTDELNFMTNASGELIDMDGNVLSQVTDQDLMNPIMKMPFIDVAMDKDFEFFVRAANSSVDFSIEFATMFSDVSEISRLQGFAQAIMMSKEEPKDLKIGPRNYLWLKLDPNDTDSAKPSFSFASPNPDLQSSISLISNFASLYLTSIGQSPKLVNASGEKETFTSGFDRFLGMIEKFETSQDDVDLFKYVEKQGFDLVRRWNNIYAQATENGFIPELSGTQIPEDVDFNIKFKGPDMVKSEAETFELVRQKMEAGLISRVEAVMMDRGISKEEAMEVLREIDQTDMLVADVRQSVEQVLDGDNQED